jgi:hypothetical protein
MRLMYVISRRGRLERVLFGLAHDGGKRLPAFRSIDGIENEDRHSIALPLHHVPYLSHS